MIARNYTDIVHIANDKEKVNINRAGLKAKTRSTYVSEQEIKAYGAYMDALEKSKVMSQASEENNQDLVPKKAREKWNEEMIRDEPALMASLRNRFINHQSIKQILDPWYLETNSKDKIDKSFNEQRSPLEVLHNNHLHITISEPNIL